MENWDQRLTLRPPPYQGAMSQLLEGIDVGDELMDNLPDSLVSPCAKHRRTSTTMDGIPQSPEPEWVNWTLVKRGQELWQANLARAFISLSGALLQGFSIARFAVVLHHAGYAQSPLTTFYRFRSTAAFLLDWFIHPLDDANSIARKSIYTVRCMHTFARRRSRNVFGVSHGEGIALSQYDLGEVQLGFSAVCLWIMETQLGMEPFSLSDRHAMVHTWRLIGWHLGIKDAFNVCNSVEHMNACMEDYMKWTPQRLTTCRAETHVLQQSSIRGFGAHLCLGERYWEGFLRACQIATNVELVDNRFPPLPGMVDLARRRMKLIGKSDALNAFVSRSICAQLHSYRTRPVMSSWFHESLAPKIACVNDFITWRIISIMFQSAQAIQRRKVFSTAVLALIALLFPRVARRVIRHPKRQL